MDKLDQYSREELLEKLTRLYNQPYLYDTINTLIDKIEEVNKLFKMTLIDVTSEEDKTFTNFVNWGKNVEQISNTIDSLMERVDPDVKAEIKNRNSATSEFTLEAITKQKKK